MSIVWLQFILLFTGIIFLILSFLKPNQESMFDEKIEKVLDEFTIQLDLGNDELIEKIKKSQEEYSSDFNKKMKRIEERIERIEKLDRDKGLDDRVNPKYAQIFELYQSGKSIDEIAKTMKMGHGEIELILELAKKGLKYV